MFGKVQNSWVDQCVPGEWKWVSIVNPQSTAGNGIIFIGFGNETRPIEALITRVRIEGFDREVEPLQTDPEEISQEVEWKVPEQGMRFDEGPNLTNQLK